MNGVEFSFEGRLLNDELRNWENTQREENRIKFLGEETRNTLAFDLFYAEQYITSVEGFKEASLEVHTSSDREFMLKILDPEVWRKYFEVGSDHPSSVFATSAIYPVSHLELRGKFSFLMRGVGGDKSVLLDTDHPESIEQFLPMLDSDIAQMNVTRDVPPGFGTFQFNPWSWPESSFKGVLSNPDSTYVKFSYEKEKGWFCSPIEVVRGGTYSRYLRDGEERVSHMRSYPMKLSEKDVILEFGLDGQLKQVIHNGIVSQTSSVG